MTAREVGGPERQAAFAAEAVASAGLGLAKTAPNVDEAFGTKALRSAPKPRRPRVPAAISEAHAILAGLGVKLGARPLPDDPEVAVNQKFLADTYRASYNESVADEREYLSHWNYDQRALTVGAEQVGMLSGWQFGKTFQLDYATPLDGKRPTATQIQAGLAGVAAMALGFDADRIMVEVDPSFKDPYKKAGFESFAKPARGPAYTRLVAEAKAIGVPIDTLEMLAIELKDRPPSRDDKADQWKTHVAQWYASNWEGIEDPKMLAIANQAQRIMNEAADRGRFIWIQALPNRAD